MVIKQTLPPAGFSGTKSRHCRPPSPPPRARHKMRSDLEFAASAIVMLLVTIGPLETAAVFGVLTSGARRAMRRRLAVEAVVIAGVVLVVFAIGGADFLRLLHVSIPAFEVAAGILLLLQSIELLFAHPSGLSALTASEEKEARATGEIAVFPLAIPLIAGPASITATMLLMRQAGADFVKVAVFFLALLLALALTWTALLLVDPLGRVLGVDGTNVIARISGILLAALAVQFMFDGIRESHLLG